MTTFENILLFLLIFNLQHVTVFLCVAWLETSGMLPAKSYKKTVLFLSGPFGWCAALLQWVAEDLKAYREELDEFCHRGEIRKFLDRMSGPPFTFGAWMADPSHRVLPYQRCPRHRPASGKEPFKLIPWPPAQPNRNGDAFSEETREKFIAKIKEMAKEHRISIGLREAGATAVDIKFSPGSVPVHSNAHFSMSSAFKNDLFKLQVPPLSDGSGKTLLVKQKVPVRGLDRQWHLKLLTALDGLLHEPVIFDEAVRKCIAPFRDELVDAMGVNSAKDMADAMGVNSAKDMADALLMALYAATGLPPDMIRGRAKNHCVLDEVNFLGIPNSL